MCRTVFVENSCHHVAFRVGCLPSLIAWDIGDIMFIFIFDLTAVVSWARCMTYKGICKNTSPYCVMSKLEPARIFDPLILLHWAADPAECVRM